MSKKQLVPKLRFKEFQSMGDWASVKLRELSTLITKGTTPIDRSGKGSINFIKVENINKNTGKITPVSKISRDEHEGYLNRSKLHEGDILFSIAGTLGRIATIDKEILPANTNQALAIVRLNKGHLDYIKTYLKGKSVVDYIKNNPTVGAQPNLSLEQVGDFKVVLPSEYEQKKIGSFFKKIDEMIQLQQSKLNKVKDIKSAYLSEMFPKEGEKYPKKRFEGFTEPWNEYNLGEVAQIKTGNTNVQDAIPDGKYTFFDRSTDIKRIDKFYYDEETIIYPGEGSEFYPRYFSGKYALHQRAYAITSDIIHLEYLANMMMLRNNHFVNNAVGSTVKSLRMENFTKCKVFVPSLDEQKKIAQLFKNINNQISIEEEKLAKLEKLKQAYLNDMFV